jgi:hypothetical protein
MESSIASGQIWLKIKDLAQQIVDTNREVDQARFDAWAYPLFLLAVFCLPIVWYFLLDRIREGKRGGIWKGQIPITACTGCVPDRRVSVRSACSASRKIKSFS